MSGAAAEMMLKSIRDVIQKELIQQTYTLNSWDVSRMGTLDYDNLDDINLEELSKSYQRYSSTGLLELDREVLNAVRESVGIDPLPLDLPPQTEILTGSTSKSGAGYASPTGIGTSTTVSGDDTSSNNLENV